MNPLNYATLEASKRLHDAGIVMETEATWRREWQRDGEGQWYMTGNWQLTREQLFGKGELPAPSMAEVWREFGDDVYITRHWNNRKRVYETRATLTMLMCPAYTNENPTDALIDLLIFVKGQEGGRG